MSNGCQDVCRNLRNVYDMCNRNEKYMKKKNIAIMLLLLLSSIGAMAQSVESPIGKFSVIPRVGVSIANLSDNSLYLIGGNTEELKSKNQAGFLGGVDVEYRASEVLGVSLGAYYARQGARWGDYEQALDVNSGKSNDVRKYLGVKNRHLNLDYVNVPLMVKAYVAPQFAIMAGAQLGFLCGDGKMLSEETDLEKDKTGSTMYKDSRDVENVWPTKKLDVSIPVGVSYEYMNVVLDARYNIGLTKTSDDDFSKSKNKVFTFTVGYRFTL